MVRVTPIRRRPALLIFAVLCCTNGGAWAQGRPAPSEIVTLVVRPQGMFPRQVNVKAGPILFLTYNRSGFTNLSFELVRTDAPGIAPVRNTSLTRNQKAWRETITIRPGTYVMRAVERPAWSCQINVGP